MRILSPNYRIIDAEICRFAYIGINRFAYRLREIVHYDDHHLNQQDEAEKIKN